MVEKISGTIEERVGTGQETYVTSMELSSESKINEISPWIRPGTIVDMGAGAGPITAGLYSKFPDSRFIAVDIAHDMVGRMTKRFSGKDRIQVVEGDAREFKFSEKVDTIMHISNLHEIFSFTGYNHEEVIKTLANDHELLKPGGRLIIRDGVQPEPERYYIKPLNEWAFDRFGKFVKGFAKVRPVDFNVGKFHGDAFVQGRRNGFSDFEGGSLIEISSQDASEMLSKYFYSEENLPVELSEQFGIWSLREYQKILLEIGFTIKHAETYVLPYLLENHYSKDFEFYHLVNGTLSHAPYPPSTLFLVSER